MQGLLLSLGLLASSAVGFAAAAEELKIDVTQEVECDRKTVNGDKISVHYRGSLQADGKEFDASTSSLITLLVAPRPTSPIAPVI